MKKASRNHPCPHGSGKKFKKCYMGKYARKHCVYIGFKEPFQGVTFDNGQVYVHTLSGEKVKADYSFSQTHYTGKSGKDKVIRCYPNKATFDLQKSLVDDFDLIVAIDTNTKQINDHMVSISSIFQCIANYNKINQTIVFFWKNVNNIAFKNCPNNKAEKFAWLKLVNLTISSKYYNNDLRIAIITDHDLINHYAYNNNRLPIYGDIFLPNNIKLLYASSDKGKENILNKLLNECDKVSTSYLRQLEETGILSDGDSIITLNQIPTVKII